MKQIFLLLFFYIIQIASYSQTKESKDIYLKLSGGRVSLGTGDILGPSFSFEISKNIIKKSSFAMSKLLVGGEIIFENGVKNPIVQNPTPEDFLSKTFHHVSSTLLWPKAAYYPFKKIISGFNIQLGPTIGYSFRSTESRASRVVDISGQATRLSTLSFNNGFTYGYRFSTGLEFNITQKILTGFRLDFSNNNEAEINTLAGVKIGLKL